MKKKAVIKMFIVVFVVVFTINLLWRILVPITFGQSVLGSIIVGVLTVTTLVIIFLKFKKKQSNKD
jgi:L-asparagine transporter-like permease